MARLANEELKKLVESKIRYDDSGKRDLSALYSDFSAINALTSALADEYRGKADCVASPGPLGLILGAMLAAKLGVGLIPVKSCDSRIPVSEDAVRAAFIDHNNCVKALYCRKSVYPENAKVLLADDWIGTAATMQACAAIVEQAGGSVVGIASVGADYNEFTAGMIDSGLNTCAVLRK